MRLGLVALVFFFACGEEKKPKPAKPLQPSAFTKHTCKTNDDCPKRWICLAGECADPSSRAIYENSAEAVTPDKVQRHADDIAKERERRAQQVYEVD